MYKSTRKFQEKWVILVRKPFELTENVEIDEKEIAELDELDDIDFNQTFSFNVDFLAGCYDRTPLYCLLSVYYSAGSRYNYYLDELLYFLFSKDVVADLESIKLSWSLGMDKKLFEDLLKRADDKDIIIRNFEYNSPSPLYIEILSGFPSFKLDEKVDYNFSYEKYKYTLIECILLDYSIEKVKTDEEMKDVIRVLKRQGSSEPSLENMEEQIKRFEFIRNDYEKIKIRFREIYDFTKNL